MFCWICSDSCFVMFSGRGRSSRTRNCGHLRLPTTRWWIIVWLLKGPYPVPTPHAYLPHMYISSIKDYVGCTNRRLLLLDDYQPQLPVVSWAWEQHLQKRPLVEIAQPTEHLWPTRSQYECKSFQSASLLLIVSTLHSLYSLLFFWSPSQVNWAVGPPGVHGGVRESDMSCSSTSHLTSDTMKDSSLKTRTRAKSKTQSHNETLKSSALRAKRGLGSASAPRPRSLWGEVLKGFVGKLSRGQRGSTSPRGLWVLFRHEIVIFNLKVLGSNERS